MPTQVISSLHEVLKSRIEEEISHLNLAAKSPSNLYEPMAYILAQKGKRLRPILAGLSYHAVSGQPADRVIHLGLAIELFHTFSLVHDDIMDEAPLRRGKETIHIKWNEPTAILAGDGLLVESMALLVRDTPEKAAALIERYSRISMEVCEGQMEDMDFEQDAGVSIPDYLEMIRKKTAALIGGSMELGAIAGGASPDEANMFRQFGETMGIAFQLQDDLMDAFPGENFGKQVGGDILSHKKTYLLLKAFELADLNQKRLLFRLLSPNINPEKKVKGVLKIYEELEIAQHTETLIRLYYGRAMDMANALSETTHFSPIQQYLMEIAKRSF